MGFIKAAINSVGGTMADQWLDYYMPPTNLTTGDPFSARRVQIR